jgi:hypothetical protein
LQNPEIVHPILNQTLREELEPRRRDLPDDTPVTLTDLASFDALLEGCA